MASWDLLGVLTALYRLSKLLRGSSHAGGHQEGLNEEIFTQRPSVFLWISVLNSDINLY